MVPWTSWLQILVVCPGFWVVHIILGIDTWVLAIIGLWLSRDTDNLNFERCCSVIFSLQFCLVPVTIPTTPSKFFPYTFITSPSCGSEVSNFPQLLRTHIFWKIESLGKAAMQCSETIWSPALFSTKSHFTLCVRYPLQQQAEMCF